MQNHTHIVDPVMLEEQARQLSNASRCGQSAASITERAYRRELVFQFGRDLSMIKYALYAVTRRTRDLYHDISRLDDALVGIADAAREADGRAAMKIDTGRDGRKPRNGLIRIPYWRWIINLILFRFRKYNCTDPSHVKPRLPELIAGPTSSGKNSANGASAANNTTSGGNNSASSSGKNSKTGSNVSNTTKSGSTADANDVRPNPGYTKQVHEGLRNYENTNHNYQNHDYSDFSVLNGFDPDACCVKQGNINHPARNVLCVSVAQMVLHKIKTGNTTDPTSTWRGGLTHYDYSKKIGDAAVYKDQKSILREIYHQITDNKNPVMVRMARGGDTDNGHTVTVIGIRSGRTGDNLTIDDLLVMDPATGKVCTFREACKASNCKETIVSRANDYALRIPN